MDTGGWAGRFKAPAVPQTHTSLHEDTAHCSRLFLGHRPRTQPSCDSGLGVLEHSFSGRASAAARLLHRTSRFLTPRPQVLEHLRWKKKKGHLHASFQ